MIINLRQTIAFTLAETLIVMGIIGIVSALTLPNLNASTGEKEKVAKVKKIYQNLDDAVGRAQAVYGPFDEWFQNDTNAAAQSTRFAERITEFLKVTKNCGNTTGCWSTAPLLYSDGTKYEDNYFAGLKPFNYNSFVIIADGMALAFGCEISEHGGCRIKVDIDGPNKGKTQLGSDIFDFFILLDESRHDMGVINVLIPSAIPTAWTGNFSHNFVIMNYSTAWVIKNDNLDYLKCTGLNWETKTSCK